MPKNNSLYSIVVQREKEFEGTGVLLPYHTRERVISEWEAKRFSRQTSLALIEGMEEVVEGRAEGAKEIVQKIRGILMTYPEELHDEISYVLDNYLSALELLAPKNKTK